MPAYNDGDDTVEAISEVSGVVEKITDDYEIIVVNDGSTDDTALRGESVMDDSVRIMNHSRAKHALQNGGQQTRRFYLQHKQGEGFLKLEAENVLQRWGKEASKLGPNSRELFI
jgi:glycosyltransferase involved in cell wall biosynthesis